MEDSAQEPLNKTSDISPTAADKCNETRQKRLLQWPFGKAYNLDKFYRQQCNLLENYENDSRQVQDEKLRRSLRMPSGHSSPESAAPAAGAETPTNDEDPTEYTKGVAKVHPAVPRVNICEAGGKCVLSIFSDVERNSGVVAISEEADNSRSKANKLAKVTLAINISLTIAKAIASYLSGSLSIISSLVDSVVDITSGLVIWATSRAIRKHGRTRLEPIALTVVSVIMAVSSVQMIVQSLDCIINFNIDPHVDVPTLCIMVATVLVKFALFLVCRRYKDDPSVQILSQDHRNDCLSNTVALLCAFGAQRLWIYLDPIGAIVVAIYIAATWYFTGKEQLVRLSGKTAPPEFINRVLKICIDHDPRIISIETATVFHFGTRFLVEIHIVMDKETRLKDTHDVSESLQNCIESLPDVERAFVHCDYDTNHTSIDEHKNPVA